MKRIRYMKVSGGGDFLEISFTLQDYGGVAESGRLALGQHLVHRSAEGLDVWRPAGGLSVIRIVRKLSRFGGRLTNDS
jgi:hypothetical protein